MKPHAELRLCAVPLCAGLVYGTAKGLALGWNASNLFSGFLFGVVIAIVVGIPLLLWGDRRFERFKSRHLISALLQSLVAVLLARSTWLMWAVGGLALGVLYTAVVSAIERLEVRPKGARSRWTTIVAVPLSGGLVLGGAAAVLAQSAGMFMFFTLIGTLLSMLFGWPVLWLIERFFSTRWRYVLGGGISGGLIWLVFGAPVIATDPQALANVLGPWSFLLSWLMVPFLLLGLVAGGLCTLLDRLHEWRKPSR
ncbi:hypothetical protein ASF84_27275 [Pseudomonas sp. Leaf127]|uniref:hypothetical protein n=1 Tax=Pseudomonas sp. Leaf127 TaxID=1736267 RepID=UPI00070367B8|nr:hypothetical protein [Pseudomonas sp. Leaf127]KQQ62537.1 hypothetical protein ASF84_27275 [Pseudomonas sp. Leaf127]